MLDEIKSLIINSAPGSINQIMDFVKPCIQVVTTDESKSILNRSKFGGIPTMPQSIDWPINEETPLSFLAQIDLEEIAGLALNQPPVGTLYFFIQTENLGYSFPEKKGQSAVLYSPEGLRGIKTYNMEGLSHQPSIFKEWAISFQNSFSVPSYQEHPIQLLEDLGVDSADELFEQVSEEILNPEFNPIHKIGGYPNAVQGAVMIWWAAQKLGIEASEIGSRMKEISELSLKFINLLQIDFTDENLGFESFSESATAYFGILEQDMQNLRFENSLLVMQNT